MKKPNLWILILFINFQLIATKTYHEGNILELIKKYLPKNPNILEAVSH